MKINSIKIATITLLVCLIGLNAFTTVTSMTYDNNQDSSIELFDASVAQTDDYVTIIFDTIHNNAKFNEFTDFTYSLNNTFNPIVGVDSSFNLNASLLDYYDVLMIMAPKDNFTEPQLNRITDYISKGHSVFITANPESGQTINPIIKNWGLQITGNNISDHDNSVLALNSFAYPVIPATENISLIKFVNGTSLIIDENSINNSLTGATVKDVYPIMRMDDNNTEVLGAAVEFVNHARVIISGSTDMFNNTFMDDQSPSEESLFLDNTEFLIDSIRWLSRITGNLNVINATADHIGERINEGTMISTSCNVVKEGSTQNIDNIQVIGYLERTMNVYTNFNLHLENDTYTGSLSTLGLTKGWVNVHLRIIRRGYYIEDYIIGEIYINPTEMTPINSSIFIFGVLASAGAVFVISSFLLWNKFRSVE